MYVITPLLRFLSPYFLAIREPAGPQESSFFRVFTSARFLNFVDGSWHQNHDERRNQTADTEEDTCTAY